MQRPLGGVELGGTKIVCVVGRGRVVLAEETFPTDAPGETLERIAAFFRAQAERPPGALGVASFGPVELRPGNPRYGFVTETPKAGWAGTDVAGTLGRALGLPVGFDTDVDGAALAEGRYGAAAGVDTFAYLTVGTGIGGGVVAGGRVVHGLVHPELGHLSVPRLPGDDFAGVCPFHGDCLEGMASGPALAARAGRRAEDATGEEQARLVEIAAWYLAGGLRNLVYVLAPERIVVGGGVSGLPGLFPALRARLVQRLAGYPRLAEHEAASFVVPPALGGRAGAVGALLLAEAAETTPRRGGRHVR